MIDYRPMFHRYETRRKKWRQWVKQRYIDAFELQPTTLLDAACGNGFWGSLFTEYGFIVDGFDVNPLHIRDGRKRYPDVDLYAADAHSELPFGQYGVVFCRALPEFYAERLQPASVIAHRLLEHVAPGGALLLAMHSDGSGQRTAGDYDRWIHNHPHEQLTRIVGQHLDRAVSYGNSLQILARP